MKRLATNNNRYTASQSIFGAAAAVLLSSAGVVQAVDMSVTGFIRQEAAYNLSGDNSIFNQHGNPYNGETVINALGAPITRTDSTSDNDWNLMATRAELDFQMKFSDHWDAFIKVRGYFDNNVYDDSGDPNFFETPLHGDCGTALEICGEDYMIDLPAAYLDYNSGPLWVRIGNQQIAWGEALFFRVADVVNGLDLRRHSFLDWASEEYADERVAAPGIRGSYRVNEEWEIEAFVQKFTPSILGNSNTPYNVITSQFHVQQEEGFDSVDDSWNAGLRLTAQLGDLGLQFFAVSRRNPDGVYSWTESNINPFAGSSDPALAGLGSLLAQTPFELSTDGIWTSEEWFHFAGASRLDGAAGLDSAVNEFAASQLLGAFPVVGDPTGTCAFLGAATDRACAGLELDVFFDAVNGPALGGGLGPLRGHLSRTYPYENVFGWGFNYVFFDEPDTWLDQLVVRFEMSLTPDKKFTSPSLSKTYIEEDEIAASLVLEKYHRFSQAFPATYMVFEYMFKSESDMFGRHLSGMDNDGVPKGDSNFHAVAIALQQASPSLEWRFDVSVLYDLNGGLMVQPGVRWKPSAGVSVELYANIFDSDGGNDDIIESIEWADELGLRIGYQF